VEPGRARVSLSLGELFLEMSLLRMLYLPHSLTFSSAHDHFPPATFLNLTAHQVFGSPVLLLPILTSHTDVACPHLRWYILVTFPPHFHLRMSHCQNVLHVDRPLYFTIRRCISPFNLRIPRFIFRWQVWSGLFSFYVSDRFGAPYIRTGNTQDARKFFFYRLQLLVFGGQYES